MDNAPLSREEWIARASDAERNYNELAEEAFKLCDAMGYAPSKLVDSPGGHRSRVIEPLDCIRMAHKLLLHLRGEGPDPRESHLGEGSIGCGESDPDDPNVVRGSD